MELFHSKMFCGEACGCGTLEAVWRGFADFSPRVVTIVLRVHSRRIRAKGIGWDFTRFVFLFFVYVLSSLWPNKDLVFGRLWFWEKPLRLGASGDCFGGIGCSAYLALIFWTCFSSCIHCIITLWDPSPQSQVMQTTSSFQKNYRKKSWDCPLENF